MAQRGWWIGVRCGFVFALLGGCAVQGVDASASEVTKQALATCAGGHGARCALLATLIVWCKKALLATDSARWQDGTGIGFLVPGGTVGRRGDRFAYVPQIDITSWAPAAADSASDAQALSRARARENLRSRLLELVQAFRSAECSLDSAGGQVDAAAITEPVLQDLDQSSLKTEQALMSADCLTCQSGGEEVFILMQCDTDDAAGNQRMTDAAFARADWMRHLRSSLRKRVQEVLRQR